MTRFDSREMTEARFVFCGDVIGLYPVGDLHPAVVIEVHSIRFAGDDVLIEGVDVLGGAESAHVSPETLVEIRVYGAERQRLNAIGDLAAEIDAYKEDAR